MKKLNERSRSERYIILTVLGMFALTVFYFIVKNINYIYIFLMKQANNLISILIPVIIGFIITFFLYKPTDKLYGYLMNKFPKINKGKLRVISSILMLLVAIGIIIIFIWIIIPNIIENITKVAMIIEGHMTNMDDYLKTITSNPFVIKVISFFGVDINQFQNMDNLILTFLDNASSLLQNFSNYIFGVVHSLYNIFIGIFFALYMLIEKDSLISQIKRFFHVVLKPTVYERVSYIAGLTEYMFFKFLTGKALCSVIVAIICYLVASIFKINYVGLSAFIIGVTNMIPLFGPFIGAAPAILFAVIGGGFIDGVIMAIIILIAQQIDQNVLAPNILGDIVGLSGFWVLFSIIICGSLFGILGLIIGIPLFAVIKILLDEWLTKKEEQKKDKIE